MSEHKHEFVFMHGYQETLPDGTFGKVTHYDIPHVKCDHCGIEGPLYESQVEYLQGYEEQKKRYHDRIWGENK